MIGSWLIPMRSIPRYDMDIRSSHVATVNAK